MLGLELASLRRMLFNSASRIFPTCFVLIPCLIALLLAPLLGKPLTAVAAGGACDTTWKPIYIAGTVGEGNVWNAVTTSTAEDAWVVGTGSKGSTTIPTSAHWNGRKWASVPMPVVGSAYNHLYTVAGVWTNDVWAAGIFWDKQGPQSNFFLHWDGETWQHLPSPQFEGAESGILGLTAISADNVWAVGFLGHLPMSQYPVTETLVMRWDGLEWTVESSPNPGTVANQLWSISSRSSDDIWAVGYSVSESNVTQPLAMHYDGTDWTVVPTPEFESGYNALTDVKTLGNGEAWAVGQYYDSGTDRNRNLVLYWNGSDWSIVPSPTPHPTNYDFPMRAITAVDEQDVWAVGVNYRPKKGFGDPLIIRRQGNAWDKIPISSLGEWSNQLSDIAAAGTNDIWTVGYFTGDASKTIPLIQHYGPQIARPKLLTPARNEVLSEPPIFLDWQDLKCAKRYEIVVRRNTPTGVKVFSRTVWGSRTRYLRFQPGKHYVWSVRGCNDDGCGFWSNWSRFHIAPDAGTELVK